MLYNNNNNNIGQEKAESRRNLQAGIRLLSLQSPSCRPSTQLGCNLVIVITLVISATNGRLHTLVNPFEFGGADEERSVVELGRVECGVVEWRRDDKRRDEMRGGGRRARGGPVFARSIINRRRSTSLEDGGWTS